MGEPHKSLSKPLAYLQLSRDGGLLFATCGVRSFFPGCSVDSALFRHVQPPEEES